MIREHLVLYQALQNLSRHQLLIGLNDPTIGMNFSKRLYRSCGVWLLLNADLFVSHVGPHGAPYKICNEKMLHVALWYNAAFTQTRPSRVQDFGIRDELTTVSNHRPTIRGLTLFDLGTNIKPRHAESHFTTNLSRTAG